MYLPSNEARVLLRDMLAAFPRATVAFDYNPGPLLAAEVDPRPAYRAEHGKDHPSEYFSKVRVEAAGAGGR